MAFNQVTGIVTWISDPYQVSSADGSKTYIKRNIYLDVTRRDAYTGIRDDAHENMLMLEFMGEKPVAEVAKAQVGQVITVSFDLKGRTWTDAASQQQRYGINVNPFRVEVRQPFGTRQPQQQPQPSAQPQATAPVPAAYPPQGAVQPQSYPNQEQTVAPAQQPFPPVVNSQGVPAQSGTSQDSGQDDLPF